MKKSKTKLQFERHAFAMNDMACERLAKAFREAGSRLGKKKRGEFTPAEIKNLQHLRTQITDNLRLNALAKQIALLPADAPETATITPDPNDL